jgi:hypothetical protein
LRQEASCGDAEITSAFVRHDEPRGPDRGNFGAGLKTLTSDTGGGSGCSLQVRGASQSSCRRTAKIVRAPMLRLR